MTQFESVNHQPDRLFAPVPDEPGSVYVPELALTASGEANPYLPDYHAAHSDQQNIHFTLQPGARYVVNATTLAHLEDASTIHLDAAIQTGAEGNVITGYDTRLQRTVAVKVMSLSGHANVQNFWATARLQASLRHPHILPVEGITSVPTLSTGVPRPAVIMPYVNGRLLSEYQLPRRNLDVEPAIEKDPIFSRISSIRRPLSEPQILTVLMQLAGALDYLAGCQPSVVHRDVSPLNVHLVNGASGEPPEQSVHALLFDFGFAYRDQSGIELSPFNHAFAAPETREGDLAVASTDQYSLAILALYLLRENFSFGGYDFMYRQLSPGHTLHDLPHYPPAVSAVFRRATSYRPDDRFPSCGTFMTELLSAYPR